VVLKKIELRGSSIFSDQELENVAGPYLNHVLTNDIIEEIRHGLTLYYINRGYVNSGAIVPDQVIANGIVVYKIVEGKVTDIDIKGNKWLNKAYIANRLNLDAGPPLDINAIQKRLQPVTHHRIRTEPCHSHSPESDGSRRYFKSECCYV